jgi:RNA polymerase sigma factor (TIGR02999 family)
MLRIPRRPTSMDDDVTRILSAIDRGDPKAADQLLPLVYRELRRLAARRLAREAPGQTLQATALVHEVYLRLMDPVRPHGWESRGHFFAAAAEAMRRILVERARRKRRLKYGGDRRRIGLDEGMLSIESPVDDILAIDEALEQLALVDRPAAELVKLRYFAGLTTEEAAEILGLSARSAYRNWAYARAWLFRRLQRGDVTPGS